MGSVKRKPVYCGACSMDISSAVRIRCAQLGPPAEQNGGDEGAGSGPTKKHESIDMLPSGPRQDGLVPTCDEFDICGTCFCEGKEVGRHKRWHDYRVITQHAYPIFTDDWGADEELLLVSACQTFGLGNWADIAEHIGSYRTKEEVEDHYLSTYINSPAFPLPVTDVKLIDQDTFQARKKQRLEEAQQRPVPIPPPKPLASAPTCHEIAGFMPGRLEFETEWENDAEALIKDMEFGLVHRYGGDEQPSREEAMAQSGTDGAKLQPDPSAKESRQPQASAPSGRGLGAETQAQPSGEGDNDAVATANQTAEKGKEGEAGAADETTIAVWDEKDDDLEMKLTMHEIYNERIGRRLDAKHFIFERGLLEFKKLVAIEKKRPKDERDLLQRLKVFSRLQTAADHEEFANGLLYEQMLRKQISDLQEYRQAGITTFAEVEKYEKDKAARVSARGALSNYRDAILLSRTTLGKPNSGTSSREGTPRPSGPSGSTSHKPKGQLTLANSSSLQLLTQDEVRLCAELRILPKPYLFIKQNLLREFARCGGKLDKERAIEMFVKVDHRVVVRIWEELFGIIEDLADELANGDDGDTIDSDSSDSDSSSEDEGDLMGELQALQEQQALQELEAQQNGHADEDQVMAVAA